MAHEDDRFYKFFYPEHRLDQFWKCMQQHQEENHYSVQFKDIIGTMLDYYPSRRLMMADLIAHPWMQGEFPTEQEIRAEFASGDSSVNQELDSLENEPISTIQKQNRTRRSPEYGGVTYTSFRQLTELELAD